MILVRSPLRISFVGGGTDLPAFYRQYPGRTISATINKYVYLLVSPTPLVDRVTVKYQKTESVLHPAALEHPSVRAALLDLGITEGGIELGSFADLPARTGLGSSSSFAAALMKGLHAYLGKKIGVEETARAACRLELELLGEPIGKQDQYAAAYGGFNRFQFNADESVDVAPVFLGYEARTRLEESLLLFFTGITRSASAILSEQGSRVHEHINTYRAMSDSVREFETRLVRGDIPGLGAMLHDGWLMKRSLSEGVSNTVLDALYQAGEGAGAFGGKVLGAGGGGCLLFLAPADRHEAVRNAVLYEAKKASLGDFKEIPVQFVQSGTNILFRHTP